MELYYRKTQIGYVIDAGLILGVLVMALTMALSNFVWITFAVLLVLIACLPLFGALTVLIADQTLEIRFGVGLIRKRFALKDVGAFREVENPWAYGWGIRLTPHGWLYNISGRRAVEIEMGGGKKYRIGTNEPEALMGAIREAMARRQPLS
jgi:hypothetical protein